MRWALPVASEEHRRRVTKRWDKKVSEDGKCKTPPLEVSADRMNRLKVGDDRRCFPDFRQQSKCKPWYYV